MLPNHAPLVVAEQFGMLEALHPGRIDLGIGRAPGTDQTTARGAAAHRGGLSADELPAAAHRADRATSRLAEGTRRDRQRRARHGQQAADSGCSAPAATARRSPACSACRSRSPTTSAPQNTLPALELYRKHFRPVRGPRRAVRDGLRLGDRAPTPTSTPAGSPGPGALSFLRLRQGRPGAAAHPGRGRRLPVHRDRRSWSSRTGMATQIIGSPETVRAQLTELLDSTGRRRADGDDDRARPRRPPAFLRSAQRSGRTDARPGPFSRTYVSRTGVTFTFCTTDAGLNG